MWDYRGYVVVADLIHFLGNFTHVGVDMLKFGVKHSI